MRLKNKKTMAKTMNEKQIILDDVVNVYTDIVDFMLTGEQLEKVGNAEKRQEIIDKTVGVTTSFGKCLLNIFSCGLAGSLFEGAKDIVGSVKGNKNEVETLSSVYNDFVKKYNKEHKADGNVQKLQTVDEKLEDIRKKYKISKSDFKKISAPVAEHLHTILLKKLREEQERQSTKIETLEKENVKLKEINKQQDEKLDELRKAINSLEQERKKQTEQLRMLEAMIREHVLSMQSKEQVAAKNKWLQDMAAKKCSIKRKIRVRKLASTSLDSGKTEAQQQEIECGPEMDSDIDDEKTDNKALETPSNTNNYLRDKHTKIKGANNTMDAKFHGNGLGSQSMPC